MAPCGSSVHLVTDWQKLENSKRSTSMLIFRGRIWSRGSELSVWKHEDLGQTWLYHLTTYVISGKFLMHYEPLFSQRGIEIVWWSQDSDGIDRQTSTNFIEKVINFMEKEIENWTCYINQEMRQLEILISRVFGSSWGHKNCQRFYPHGKKILQSIKLAFTISWKFYISSQLTLLPWLCLPTNHGYKITLVHS